MSDCEDNFLAANPTSTTTKVGNLNDVSPSQEPRTLITTGKEGTQVLKEIVEQHASPGILTKINGPLRGQILEVMNPLTNNEMQLKIPDPSWDRAFLGTEGLPLLRYRVNIPEFNSFIPSPEKFGFDPLSPPPGYMSLFPPFICKSGVDNTRYSVGDYVWVDFSDRQNLRNPYIIEKIVSEAQIASFKMSLTNQETNILLVSPPSPNAQIPSVIQSVENPFPPATGVKSGRRGAAYTEALLTNQQLAYDAAIKEGLSEVAARSLVANMSGEALHVPDDRHFDPPKGMTKQDPGAWKRYAHGIVQWNTERAERIKKRYGQLPNNMTVEQQTVAAIWEIRTFYPKVFQALQGNDPNVMIDVLVRKYEIPADKETAISQRKTHYLQIEKRQKANS